MLKENNKVLRRTQQFTDILVTALSFLLAYELRRGFDALLVPVKPFTFYLFLLYIVLPLWGVLLYLNGAYASIRTKSLTETVSPVFKSVFTGGIILTTVLYIFKLESISRALVFFFLAANLISLLILRASLYLFSHYIRKKGYNYRSVLVVGTGKRVERFAEVLEGHREWGIKVLGFIDHEGCSGIEKRGEKEPKVIGSLVQLKGIITSLQVDEVVFVVPLEWLSRIEEAVLTCEKVGIKASIAADFYQHKIARTSIEELSGWPLLVFNPTHRLEGAVALKRAADIVLSLAGFITTLPFFIVSAVLIKLSSPGPVFFRQERCGLNGRRFNVLKFRTMVERADELKENLIHLNEMSGPVFKVKKDPRVTPVGRFLRKYSLDELPQLLNVLRGDMSIVGPRPPLPSEVERYDIWQRRRLSVRPGLTCSWQVNGRNGISFEDWMRLDLEYIDNWSLKQDMKIILKTIPAVLRGTGV